MAELRDRIKQIPWIGPVASMVGERLRRRKLRGLSAEQVFTGIYQENSWQGVDSVSGTGSDDTQTTVLVGILDGLLPQLGVASVLDIPCGDFRWMRRVRMDGVAYIGADIVEDLVEATSLRHGQADRSFVKLDLIEDPLPQVDLVFCRDCLVHLSEADVWRALRNVCASNSSYLLTTTFVDHPRNEEIETGQWRTLNLESAPFHLPPPEQLLSENCTEEDGAYSDKSLGLWRIDVLRKHLGDAS